MDKPFNWVEFLSVDKHTEEEWHEAKRLAGEWPTCACGKLNDKIPIHDKDEFDGFRFNQKGQPKDKYLSGLGMTFYGEICSNDVNGARKTMYSINRREVSLLKEIECQKNA